MSLLSIWFVRSYFSVQFLWVLFRWLIWFFVIFSVISFANFTFKPLFSSSQAMKHNLSNSIQIPEIKCSLNVYDSSFGFCVLWVTLVQCCIIFFWWNFINAVWFRLIIFKCDSNCCFMEIHKCSIQMHIKCGSIEFLLFGWFYVTWIDKFERILWHVPSSTHNDTTIQSVHNVVFFFAASSSFPSQYFEYFHFMHWKFLICGNVRCCFLLFSAKLNVFNFSAKVSFIHVHIKRHHRLDFGLFFLFASSKSVWLLCVHFASFHWKKIFFSSLSMNELKRKMPGFYYCIWKCHQHSIFPISHNIPIAEIHQNHPLENTM